MPESTAQKPAIVKVLQWINLIVFLTSVTLVIAMHNLSESTLQTIRVPTFLQQIDQFLDYAWPASLHVYQVVLVIFLLIIFVNSLGLILYTSVIWRTISDLLSFLGLFLVWTAGVFFVLALSLGMFTSSENVQTALIFLIVSVLLFLLDLVTFFVDEQHLGRKFIKGKGR